MDQFKINSARIAQLREEVINAQARICTQRAKIITESYRQNEDQPIVMKRALAVKEILEKMSIFIADGDLIAGNQASHLRAAPIYPEYAVDWIIKELDQFEKRPGDRFTLAATQKEELKEICRFWKGKTLKERGLSMIPEKSRTLYNIGVIKAEGNLTSGDGHIAVNFEKVLQKGLSGLTNEVKEKINQLDLTDYRDLKKLPFLKSILIVFEAIIRFTKRYSELALQLARKEKDSTRKNELLTLSQICSKVPLMPAQTFYEGIQSVWFIQLILQIESNGHSVSYGRLDQYLYSLYQNDLRQGTLTDNQALELLANLWIKTYSINKIRSWSHTRFSAGSPLYQNVTIGGQTIDGKDAVNELSGLILRSVGMVKLTQPNLTVRYHRNMPENFMRECINVIKLGFGMPAFNNDERIIPALKKLGIKQEHAYNYSAVGCVEVAVPGKWGYRCTGMSFLNFPKILMTALNNGIEPQSGLKIFKGCGKLADFKQYSDVEKAWSEHIRFFTQHQVIIDAAVDLAIEALVPDIFCSALVDDCIERGKHLKEGGAVYDFISGLQVGIANLGNSLAALKKLVYDEKVIPREKLVRALESNFQDSEGEEIRQILLNKAPKFGQNDQDVDQLLIKAYQVYIDEIFKHKNTRYGRGPIGGTYFAGTSSISANVPCGAVVGATPDGRKAYTPLAEGCSPTHGTDFYGPTAVFHSVAKLPADQICGGVLLNQKISPQVIKNEADVNKFSTLIRTFFNDLKGWHVQYNVVSKQTLLDAQKQPENYRDLIVRVAGYSAFFTILSPETQNDIIERTEHSLQGI